MDIERAFDRTTFQIIQSRLDGRNIKILTLNAHYSDEVKQKTLKKFRKLWDDTDTCLFPREILTYCNKVVATRYQTMPRNKQRLEKNILTRQYEA